MKLIILLLTFSSLSFGQYRPGGGGDSADELVTIKTYEAAFVATYRDQYKLCTKKDSNAQDLIAVITEMTLKSQTDLKSVTEEALECKDKVLALCMKNPELRAIARLFVKHKDFNQFMATKYEITDEKTIKLITKSLKQW